MIGKVAFESDYSEEVEGDACHKSKTPKCRKAGNIIDPDVDV